MVGMLILSFAIAYPVFMFLIWFLARLVFTPLDQAMHVRRRETALLLAKARRVRRSKKQHVPEREFKPVLVMSHNS
jgi:F0F1-type ATP synthase membrane subunit b/b'